MLGCFTPANPKIKFCTQPGAESTGFVATKSRFQLIHKGHFPPGRLQLLASGTYRRARLFESDRLRLISILSVGRRTALCASPECRSPGASAFQPNCQEVAYITERWVVS
jgi:hypothetical protein